MSHNSILALLLCVWKARTRNNDKHGVAPRQYKSGQGEATVAEEGCGVPGSED
jgi:hypothetical protein